MTTTTVCKAKYGFFCVFNQISSGKKKAEK
jgi:hypothetical protein